MTSWTDFGWYPEPLDGVIGPITLATLPGLNEAVSAVRDGPGVDGDWVYAPLARTHVMGEGVIERAYPSRIFGLPMTHRLCHAGADGSEHLEFLVWGLSFFVGMRLTTTEAGFLDAAATKPRKLVDFVLTPRETIRAIGLAEGFWQANKSSPFRARLWVAALHALYIAQAPQALQFEQFLYLYGALDACFALARDYHPLPKGGVKHHSRVRWLCELFQIPVPSWADDTAGASPVSVIRNATVHESLFMDAPLGFAVHGVGTNQNLPLEMQAVVCRLLVALLGDPSADYVRSPVDTRQMHGWSPP
ncbi:hypothetical protein [Sphingomonas sp. LHG3406-1]|uniref:hypothetical protein n=1 Tax=Sphingomonas sp. LHG3406-1 TaxID=2804617 RepID=UPI0026230632|nr:hypothetical protein [Sphingomonas sp. LHG3406-1]